MKNKLKVTILLSAAVAFLFAGLVITKYTRTQEKVVSTKKAAEVPVVDFESQEKSNGVSSSENPGNEARSKKNSRYNNRNAVWELPGDLTVKPKSGHWVLDVPAIPAGKSDGIVIGKVKSGKAFLSDDKTGIYSEFTIYIEQVLKSNSFTQEGQEIVAERAGGAVRFPSGKVQRIEVYKGQEMPQIETSYIFFLKKLDNERDFSILTAYRLQGEMVEPLDAISPYTEYQGVERTEFINKIIDEIRNPSAVKQEEK